MSLKSEPLSAAHFSYIAGLTRPQSKFLGELRQAASIAGIPDISISPEQASFMQILLQLIAAQEVVEVGTLGGYSAIAMAQALPATGRVRSIELEAAHADFAESWVAKSEAAGKTSSMTSGSVEVHRGDGREILPGFADNSADAAFIDADKAGYPLYLKECQRIVRPGGLLMVDNALAFGQVLAAGEVEESVLHIRAFNQQMAACTDLQGVIVPLGDGCWVAVNGA